MSYQSNNLDLEVLEEGDPADLTTVSDNFDKIDANIGNVATFETSPATAAHSIGDYIIYQGQVHRVIANISEGNNLIRGTNIAYTDVWHEVKSLQSSVNNLQSLVGNGWRTKGDITDFNNSSSFGVHSWNTATLNKPSSGYGIAITFSQGFFGANNAWIMQVGFGTDERIWFRQKINTGSWTSWREIAKVNTTNIQI